MYLLVVYMSIHIRTFSEPRHCYLPPEVVSVLGERDPGCLGFMVLTSGFCPEDMKCSLHLDIHCNLCVKGFQGSYFDICCTSSMHVYVRVNIYIHTCKDQLPYQYKFQNHLQNAKSSLVHGLVGILFLTDENEHDSHGDEPVYTWGVHIHLPSGNLT